MKRTAWVLVTMFGFMGLGSLGAAAQEAIIYRPVPPPVVVYRPVPPPPGYWQWREEERREWLQRQRAEEWRERQERREWRERQEWREHERWEHNHDRW